MLYILYVIYGIISSLSCYIFSSFNTIFLLFNYVFNTENIYDKNLLVFICIGISLGFIFLYIKLYIKKIISLFKKKDKKNKIKEKRKNNHKYFIITIIIYLFSFILLRKFSLKIITPKIIGFNFIISALMLFIVRNKKGNKAEHDIKIINIIFISLGNIISILFNLNCLITTFFIFLLSNFKLNTTLKYSLGIYLTNLLGFILSNIFDLITTLQLYYLPYYLIACITTFISIIYFFNKFKEKLKNNQFKYFIILNLLLGIFTFIYFR